MGTKAQAAPIIAAETKRSNSYYVNHRWLGGMLTNWKTVKTRVERLNFLQNEEKEGLFENGHKKRTASRFIIATPIGHRAPKDSSCNVAIYSRMLSILQRWVEGFFQAANTLRSP